LLASGSKMITSAGTAGSTGSIDVARTIVHARVRIASTWYFAPHASPARRTTARPNVVNRCTSTSVHATLESTIGLDEVRQLEFAVISDSSSRAEAHDFSFGYHAASVSSTRVRRASSRDLAGITEESGGTFAAVGSVDAKRASSSVHARSSESAISREEGKVLLEEIHQVPFAVGSNEGTRAHANGLTVSTTVANTVVHARVVESVTHYRSVTVLPSVVGVASALVANTNNVYAATSVLTRLSAISKVNGKGVLTQNTKIISRTEAVSFSTRNVARTTV